MKSHLFKLLSMSWPSASPHSCLLPRCNHLHPECLLQAEGATSFEKLELQMWRVLCFRLIDLLEHALNLQDNHHTL